MSWSRLLRYPTVREQISDLDDDAADKFVNRLAFRGIVLRRVRHRFDYPRAHQDEPYLDLAAAARANFLVSRDRDLLALRDEHSMVAKEVRRICRNLRIVDPVEFLRVMRNSSWR